MHPYPHVYIASAQGRAAESIEVKSPGLPSIVTSPPPQFGGPDGIWSPETLLCAAVADCFILTFRAVSRAAKLEWDRLDCRVEGTLERVEGVTQFTRFATFAELVVAPGVEVSKASALLEKSEHACLIANSLKAARSLEVRIVDANGALVAGTS